MNNFYNIESKWCGISSLYDISKSIYNEIENNRNSKSVFANSLYNNISSWCEPLREFIQFVSTNTDCDFINELALLGPHKYDESNNLVNLIIAPDNTGKIPLKKANISLKTKLLINRIDHVACKIFRTLDPNTYRKQNINEIDDSITFNFVYRKITSDNHNNFAKIIFNLWEFFNEKKIVELFDFFKVAKELSNNAFQQKINNSNITNSNLDRQKNNFSNVVLSGNEEQTLNNTNQNTNQESNEDSNITPQVIILGNPHTTKTWDFNNLNTLNTSSQSNQPIITQNNSQNNSKHQDTKKYYPQRMRVLSNSNNTENHSLKNNQIKQKNNNIDNTNLDEEEINSMNDTKGWKTVGKNNNFIKASSFSLTNRTRKI